VRKISFILLLLLVSRWPRAALCAQRAQAADADRLGLGCAQILEMSSTEWIAYFGAKTKLDVSTSVRRASATYGKCYQRRTDSLAAKLERSGQSPSRAARADFAEFEAALRDFTAKALAGGGSVDPRKQALAALYERQFGYEFYRQYEPKIVKPGEAQKPAAASGGESAQGQTKSPAASTPHSASDTDEMTKAKNRFGELLAALPDDKLHELHAAFGEVIGLHALSGAMRLAVYRYAIFLLEPSDQASYPPPF
jgi:hypothetical protein